MRVEKIAICFSAVAWRRNNGCSAQHHLVYHKLAVVLADSAVRFFEAGVG